MTSASTPASNVETSQDGLNAFITSLSDLLEAHPGATYFLLGADGTFLPREENPPKSLRGAEAGTMQRLRARLAAAGWEELSRHPIFHMQDHAEENSTLQNPLPPPPRLGEDPLTPARLGRIVQFLRNQLPTTAPANRLQEEQPQAAPQVLPYPGATAKEQPQENRDSQSESYFREVEDLPLSDQERFERAVEMIAGRGLALDDKIGAELRTGELDGVEMIAQLAEGKIEFPLRGSLANTSETSAAGSPEYSLADYSLRELRHDLAFALEENIKKLEERIDILRATEEQRAHLQKTIEYLECYKESLTMGREILRNLTEHIEEPGEREVAFAFRVIEIIHECFSTHAQALEEMNRDVTREDIERARYLNNQAHALIDLAAELSREQPRESLLKGYREALTLYRQALEELTTGSRDIAFYLYHQGLARYRATKEAAGANRADIVRGYKEASELYRQAVATDNF